MKKNVFVRKPYNSQLYLWSPIESDKKGKINNNFDKMFCNALPRTIGEDWNVTYVYNSILTNDNQIKRIAYVACDYVK